STRLISISVIFIVLFEVIAAAQTVSEDRVAFTVIESPWLISLDSRNLEIKDQQVKHDNQSGYFLLYDEISLVKSLEKIPDHSGAVLKYQSSFGDQKDVFETFF